MLDQLCNVDKLLNLNRLLADRFGCVADLQVQVGDDNGDFEALFSKLRSGSQGTQDFNSSHAVVSKRSLARGFEGQKRSTVRLQTWRPSYLLHLCQQSRRTRLAIDFSTDWACVSHASDVLGVCVMITSALLQLEPNLSARKMSSEK